VIKVKKLLLYSHAACYFKKRGYFEYEDYGKGNIKDAENGMQSRDSSARDVNFEAVKADMIS